MVVLPFWLSALFDDWKMQPYINLLPVGKTSFAGNRPPSKTVSTGPEIKASHSKKFSSEIGPARIPSGGFIDNSKEKKDLIRTTKIMLKR